MTGNVAQVFLTDEAWSATLRGIHRALRPGGHVVFESRRPQARAWEQRAAETAEQSWVVPGVGRVVGLPKGVRRSEEHTSELQSRRHLVCRLLLEKKRSSAF